MEQIIQTPDLGVDSAEIIEILVSEGQTVEKEQGIAVIESDKASMEVPSPYQGRIGKLHVKVGDTIQQGTQLATISSEQEETSQPANSEATEQPEQAVKEKTPPDTTQQTGKMDITVPDLGVDSARVIELLVQPGDTVTQEQGILLLESDKASMEMPSPYAGTLVDMHIAVDSEVTSGMVVATVRVEGAQETATQQEATTKQEVVETAKQKATPTETPVQQPAPQAEAQETQQENVYAGPGVRKLARELGIDIQQVTGSGRNNRIIKEDIHSYVKNRMQQPGRETTATVEIDFSQFGEIETTPMSKIKQLTAESMMTSWQHVPRVTQFDEADITELERFRKEVNADADNKEAGRRVTLLAFLVAASVNALQKFPQFNTSLTGNTIVQKKYYNIGIAVDTPHGLMVPVIKDADTLGIFAIAEQIRVLAKKAREKKISPQEMQGGCFSLSSLGGIGGTGFTPIVNYPEAAILGIANSAMQPVWDGSNFIPRLICPLSLSYDHRLVNGAESARFLREIAQSASDIRSLLL